VERKLQDKTKELDLFSKEFADNFAVLTSKEIACRD